MTLAGSIDVGDWTYASGVVDAGTSTVNFMNDASPRIVDAGAMHFHDVVANANNGGGGIVITDTMYVDGDLTVNNDHLTELQGGTVSLVGNLIWLESGGNQATTAFIFTGGNAQTFSYTAGTLDNGDFTVAKTAGTTLTLESDMLLPGGGQSFTITSGIVALNGHTLTIGSAPMGTMTVTGADSVLECDGGCGAGNACDQGLDQLQCAALSVTNGGTVTP